MTTCSPIPARASPTAACTSHGAGKTRRDANRRSALAPMLIVRLDAAQCAHRRRLLRWSIVMRSLMADPPAQSPATARPTPDRETSRTSSGILRSRACSDCSTDDGSFETDRALASMYHRWHTAKNYLLLFIRNAY